MPSKIVMRYECRVCYQTHSDSYDATNCCEPETIEMHLRTVWPMRSNVLFCQGRVYMACITGKAVANI